jgi:hypothetical protein
MPVTSAELRKAASDNGIDLELPQNAFLVCRKDPQGGWIQIPAKDYMAAEQKAVEQAGGGKFHVYVISANSQHGLMKAVHGKLQPVRGHVRENRSPETLCGLANLPEQDWCVQDESPRESNGLVYFGAVSLDEITCAKCQAELPRRLV